MRKVLLQSGARIVAVAAFAFISAAAHANLILNGDFENNSAAGTQFNMSNVTFNGTVANATAFGSAEEIDLVTGTAFGIAPQSGNWKLGLHQQTTGLFDAFSMALSSSLVAGNNYTLRFFGALLGGETGGNIGIGLSGSATSFGTQFFAGTPASATGWTEFDISFTAATSADFITVQINNTNGYSFVDNFSLVANNSVPEPDSLALLGLAIAGLGMMRRRKTVA